MGEFSGFKRVCLVTLIINLWYVLHISSISQGEIASLMKEEMQRTIRKSFAGVHLLPPLNGNFFKFSLRGM